MTWYRRTHSWIKVANTAVARLPTKLANQNMCVAVGAEAGLGGAGGLPELFELAAWSR
jgi:hypothetical protein